MGERWSSVRRDEPMPGIEAFLAAATEVSKRHVPDRWSAVTQTFICMHCNKQWPCPDRKTVSPLLPPDPYTRLSHAGRT